MLCWLVYACSYIGKLSYSANINQIEISFGVSYKQAGTVSTFFFFAYGIGQVVNGLLCKKYNIKYVIFFSLLVASVMNLLMVNVSDFSLMKYFWLINGVAMSFLWTSLIRLLSETLDKNEIAKAVVIMGTTVASGTFLVYGMSALFVAVASFQLTFYVASAVLLTVAIVWLVFFNNLVNPLRAERESEREEITEEGAKTEEKSKNGVGFTFFICVLAVFAVINNFVKDGLTSWTPDILDTLYDTPGWLSILLTLLLPALAIFGAIVAVALHKKIRNFVLLCTLLFFLTAILIGIVIGFLSASALVVTIGSFALVSCLMAGVNNVITSMVPLYMKKQSNSGMLAGVLNGFCYLGSTVSSYGLGFIADRGGWKSVFFTLLAVCCIAVFIGAVYSLAKCRKSDKAKKEGTANPYY